MDTCSPLSAALAVSMQQKETVKKTLEIVDQEESKQDPSMYSYGLLVSARTNRPVPPGGDAEPDLPTFWCDICQVHLSMPIQAMQHFTGKPHALKVKNQNNKAFGTRETANQKTGFPVNSRKSGKNGSKRGYDSWCWRPESYQEVPISEPNTKIQKLELNPSDEKLDKQLICNDCSTMFNSIPQAQQHFKGKKHALTVASNAAAKHKKVPLTSHQGKQEDMNKFNCQHCDISLNSHEQFVQHCNGIRHKHQAGEIKEIPEWWADQQRSFDQTHTKRSSGKGVTEQFKCDACDVLLNSQMQLGQHLTSLKHKENEEYKASAVRGGGIKRGRGESRGRRRGTGHGRGSFVGQNQRGLQGLGNNYKGSQGNANNRGSHQRGNSKGINKKVFTSPGGQCDKPVFDQGSSNFMPLGAQNKMNSNRSWYISNGSDKTSYSSAWQTNATPSWQGNAAPSWQGNAAPNWKSDTSTMWQNNTERVSWNNGWLDSPTGTNINQQQSLPQHSDTAYDSFYM